jgi:hypothetical protein
MKYLWLRESRAVTLSVIDIKASLGTTVDGALKVSGLVWQQALTFSLASRLEH